MTITNTFLSENIAGSNGGVRCVSGGEVTVTYFGENRALTLN